jgi:hypothetical protein
VQLRARSRRSGWRWKFYARGHVYNVEPSGQTVEVKRFEPKEIFLTKHETEAFALKLAKKWIDDHFQMWIQCFGSKSL